MEPEVISVKQFVAILNETLSFAYPEVTVEGEVSGFKVSQGKWVFFDLKDEEATLNCFMPIYALKVELADGMKVRVAGSPRLTKWGRFSFTAKRVSLAGEGELRRAFELLRAKLEAEGLFAAERKRPLPSYPAQIGLITSVTSAAYQDFIKVLGQRWGGIQIKLADVQVQGEPAPNQITGAIEYFNQLAQPVDVLVITRGGGSLEDLQAFNMEQVARAVASSRTPTVVGVGHETDISLADLVADVRAATPTDAARLVVPDRQEFIAQLSAAEGMMLGRVRQQWLWHNQQLQRQFKLLYSQISRPFARLQAFEAMLARDFSGLQAALLRQRQGLAQHRVRLLQAQQVNWQQQSLRLQNLGRVLASFNPAATLKRGYAIVRHKGQVLRQAAAVGSGESLMIQLAEGKISARAEEVNNESKD